MKKHEIASTAHKSRKSWNIASNDDVCLYKHKLDEMLNNISMPADCIICTNVLCTNNSHIDSIQKLHDDLISASIIYYVLLIAFPTLVNPKEKYQGGILLLVMLEKLLFFGEAFGLI